MKILHSLLVDDGILLRRETTALLFKTGLSAPPQEESYREDGGSGLGSRKRSTNRQI